MRIWLILFLLCTVFITACNQYIPGSGQDCSKITNSIHRDNCYLEQISCRQVSWEGWLLKMSCYYGEGIPLNDKFCEEMVAYYRGESYSGELQKKETNYNILRYQCFSRLSTLIKEPSYCRRIIVPAEEEEGYTQIQSAKAECLFQSAARLNSSVFCDEMKEEVSARRANSCYIEMAFRSGNIEFCEKLVNLYSENTREWCFEVIENQDGDYFNN